VFALLSLTLVTKECYSSAQETPALAPTTEIEARPANGNGKDSGYTARMQPHTRDAVARLAVAGVPLGQIASV
jgi:hypothetical protein